MNEYAINQYNVCSEKYVSIVERDNTILKIVICKEFSLQSDITKNNNQVGI